MICISYYDNETHLPTLLPGGKNDYLNVKKTFNFIRGYSMVYLNENDKLI